MNRLAQISMALHSHRVFYKGVSNLLVILLLVTLALGSSSQPASAANFTVNDSSDAVDNNPGDGSCDVGAGQCTLRAAIMEANALPGPDTITLPAGTYTLTLGPGDDDSVNGAVGASGDLDIMNDDLTINGAGAGTTTIRAGTDSSNGIDRVFDVDPPFGGLGLSLTLSGVTVRNGRAPAPSGAGGDGGGVRFFGENTTTPSSPGTLTLTNCILQDNTALAGLAGGIEVTGGSLSMSGTNVQSNIAMAGAGGGVYFDNLGNGNLTITGGSISSNQATDATFGNGGGLYIVDAGSASLSSLAIDSNSAALDGGGVYQASGSLSLNSVSLSSNTAGGNGSGVLTQGTVGQAGPVTLTGDDYYQDSGAYNGGASTFTVGGTLTLTGGSFDATSDVTSLSGDFVVGPGVTFAANGGEFRFNGATAQNLSLDSNVAFYDLTVGNGVTLVETASSDNASVSNTLTNGGIIRKAQVISASGAKTFGLTGVAVNVTVRAGLTDLSVDRIDSNSTHGTGSSASGTNTGRYWQITPTGAGFTLDLTLPHSYPADDSNTHVCEWVAGPGSGWDCARSASNATTVTRNGITSLSEWAVGYLVGPTAITLRSFEAQPERGRMEAGLVALFVVLALLALVVRKWARERVERRE